MSGPGSAGGAWTSASEAPRGPSEAPARPLLLILVAAVFVAVLASSMVNVIVPVIGEAFGADDGRVGWVVTANLLALAVSTPLAGRASDVLGLRCVFAFGLLAFALGSLVCALAPASSLAVLILGRVLQGAGEGTLPALAAVAVTRCSRPASAVAPWASSSRARA